jgi:hypothetical protein
LRNPSQQPVRFFLVFLAEKIGFYATRQGSCGYHDGLRCAAPILPGAVMTAKRGELTFCRVTEIIDGG